MTVSVDREAFRAVRAAIYDELTNLFEDKQTMLLIHSDKPSNDQWETIVYLLQAATMASVIETLRTASKRLEPK